MQTYVFYFLNIAKNSQIVLKFLFIYIACACDKLGSINDAKCDPYTDESKNLIAGRCHCKPLVVGDRCESCKDGYFNLTKENSEGCQRKYKYKFL